MLTRLKEEYSITIETLESFSTYWIDSQSGLDWNCIFVLPAWVTVWLNHFGKGMTPYFYAGWHADVLIGIAPLLIQNGTAQFVGSADVCDYQDFIAAPGYKQDFFALLIEYLRQQGISRLNLGPVRADSAVFSNFTTLAHNRHCMLRSEPEDVTFELNLPATWEEYLQGLSGKQRHEVRRKMRRLHEAGDITYRVVSESAAVRDECAVFLELFRLNRSDKVAFMTEKMAIYFQSLVQELAHRGIVRLGFLELDTKPVAAVMFFEYNATIFLYNSGYDDRFSSLNVGLLSKIFSLRHAIERGCKKYDFLKGSEVYKQRLGAQPVQLLRYYADLC